MSDLSPDNHGLRLTVRYAVLVIIAIIFVFPLVFMLMSSLKPDQQLLTDTGSLRAFLPIGDISLNNYTAAFKRAPVGLFVFNSVLVTGVTVVLSLLICSMAAFAFVFTNWLAGGGIRGGISHGPSDEFGYKPADRNNPTTVYDVHATVLRLLGIDHERLTVRHNGSNRRLTDVHGHVIKELLA